MWSKIGVGRVKVGELREKLLEFEDDKEVLIFLVLENKVCCQVCLEVPLNPDYLQAEGNKVFITPEKIIEVEYEV